MSREGTYLGLLAALRQEELLGEAMRRQRSTQVIRHRRNRGIADRLRRAIRGSRG
ncbi:MAG TPA: hypothetical protein VF013_09420 [Candidatus Limnocylindria bacterium]